MRSARPSVQADEGLKNFPTLFLMGQPLQTLN